VAYKAFVRALLGALEPLADRVRFRSGSAGTFVCAVLGAPVLALLVVASLLLGFVQPLLWLSSLLLGFAFWRVATHIGPSQPRDFRPTNPPRNLLPG
jgi:hypothetical protein